MSDVYPIKQPVKAPGFIGDGSQLTIEGEKGNLKEVLSKIEGEAENLKDALRKIEVEARNLKDALSKKLDKSGGDITGSLTIVSGLSAGKMDPNALLDVRGNVNIKGDIDVNDKRLSNYKGFPRADFIEQRPVAKKQEYTFTHNFGSLPSLVQVWVKSDGQNNSKGVYADAKEWKMAGVLCLLAANKAYGTIVEKIDSKVILIRTGNNGLFHGGRGYNYFQSGEVRVMAWK